MTKDEVEKMIETAIKEERRNLANKIRVAAPYRSMYRDASELEQFARDLADYIEKDDLDANASLG